ncbi:MAG: glycosyltransferase family 4 protein [Candidatus Coatesbacteria bacterium]|nr:glycosyltransferase family 4 protein [Candidatus Coatesbacteria bacterium]
MSKRTGDNEKAPRITIICGYPPPYVGMPIYAERFSAYLLRNGFDCKVINMSPEKRQCKADHVLAPAGGRFLKYFSSMLLLLFNRSDLVHINASSSWSFWGSLSLCAFCRLLGRKVVLSVHGGSFPGKVRKYNAIVRLAARLGLAFPHHLICINEKIRKVLESLGISRGRTSLIPVFCLAYLPQSIPRADISRKILEFCESHSPVIVAVPRLEIQSSGGWQTPILAFPLLKQRLPEVGMVIVGSGDKEKDCRQMIISKGLSEDIFLAVDVPHPEAIAIFKELADVLVRPTGNDGDASFVREGLALCKPMVASDTDFRPDGVVLFKIGDAEDLAEKVEYALEHREEIQSRLKDFEHPDYFAETVKVYERVARCALRNGEEPK